MSKFIAGHVTKTWFLSYELPLAENKMLHLHFKENVEKDDVVTFTAHLNVTNKRLTRHKQKVWPLCWRSRVCPPTWWLIQIILLCWKIEVPWNISLKCVSFQISSQCKIIFMHSAKSHFKWRFRSRRRQVFARGTLTIRQRPRKSKHRWKIDFVLF